MIRHETEFMISTVENPKCGYGSMEKKQLLSEEELLNKGRIFAELTIHPNSCLGYHEHTGDYEAYYIISGQGEYNDNGVLEQVSVGDLCFVRCGEGHGLKNTGDNDLHVIALVLYC